MDELKKESVTGTTIEVKGPFVTVYVNAFNEESAKTFFTQFEAAKAAGQKIVPVYIDSYGGYVDALSVMVDAILAYPGDVATVCIGKACSCGQMLLACGSPGMRYAAPNSRIMLHNVASGAQGKTPVLEVSTAETKRLEQQMFRLIAKRCGQPADYFLKLLKAAGFQDIWMTPEDAKKHKLVDHIKVPTIKSETVTRVTIK
jgi:ATP-dependent Clp protease protease subunit